MRVQHWICQHLVLISLWAFTSTVSVLYFCSALIPSFRRLSSRVHHTLTPPRSHRSEHFVPTQRSKKVSAFYFAALPRPRICCLGLVLALPRKFLLLPRLVLASTFLPRPRPRPRLFCLVYITVDKSYPNSHTLGLTEKWFPFGHVTSGLSARPLKACASQEIRWRHHNRK